MPPRWPREPDRNDPEFRQADDKMTFAFHVAVYCAVNSGMWFLDILLKANWSWAAPVTAIWASIVLGHGLYIYTVADYSPKSDG
jgi:hypothetical protein